LVPPKLIDEIASVELPELVTTRFKAALCVPTVYEPKLTLVEENLTAYAPYRASAGHGIRTKKKIASANPTRLHPPRGFC
jgi:hypothetical protein